VKDSDKFYALTIRYLTDRNTRLEARNAELLEALATIAGEIGFKDDELTVLEHNILIQARAVTDRAKEKK